MLKISRHPQKFRTCSKFQDISRQLLIFFVRFSGISGQRPELFKQPGNKQVDIVCRSDDILTGPGYVFAAAVVDDVIRLTVADALRLDVVLRRFAVSVGAWQVQGLLKKNK